MFDINGLAVTASKKDEVDVINSALQILFHRRTGLGEILPKKANEFNQCPMLQVYSALMYFSTFSCQAIKEFFPTFIVRLAALALNERESKHLEALKALEKSDFSGAKELYAILLTTFPKDCIALYMLETCAFLEGDIEFLDSPYQSVSPYYKSEPDFQGMVAFLYCHVGRKLEARDLVLKNLEREPYNAWLQHVYAHTLDETDPDEVQRGLEFEIPKASNWKAQNRFFQGHNWMHICGLKILKSGKDIDLEEILGIYSDEIWGEARAFNFEQNNAFWVLWLIDLYTNKQVPLSYWHELASYAEKFRDDFFTPYLTVSAMLSIVKSKPGNADACIAKYKEHMCSFGVESQNYKAWMQGLNALEGCVAYLRGNVEEARLKLSSIYRSNRMMGHSDEQRNIFNLTYECLSSLISDSV